MKTTFIYVLKCPLSGEIRYVGKTNNPKQRYKNHLNKAHGGGTHKRNWINFLRKKGLKPVFEIIKQVPMDEWKDWEKYYIKYYKGKGYKLVNFMDGGEGLTFGNQTSFKKGGIPWNKGSRMKKSCVICGNKFEVSPSGAKRYECCSTRCTNIYRGICPNEGRFKKGNVPWIKGRKGFVSRRKGCSVSEEVKKRISETLIKLYSNGYNGAAKPVLQIDPRSDSVIKDFSSAAEASRQTGVLGSSISAATNGRTKTAGGFKWKKKEDL